jgi:hypothetical protein
MSSAFGSHLRSVRFESQPRKDYPKTVRGFAVPVLSHVIHPPFSPTLHTNMNHCPYSQGLGVSLNYTVRVRISLRLAVYLQSVRLGAKPLICTSQETYYITDAKNNRLIVFRNSVTVH